MDREKRRLVFRDNSMSDGRAQFEQAIQDVAVATGFPREAILFVLHGWSNFELQSNTRVDTVTLCWRLHDRAIEMFGSQAREQLAAWKITKTLDFGSIVFGLIARGLPVAIESDRLDDFRGVFEFEHRFEELRYQKSWNQQWRLSTLFLITTVAAVAYSGFSRNGLSGVVPAVFSSWIAALGFALMLSSWASRKNGWLLAFLIGSVFFVAGVCAFYVIS